MKQNANLTKESWIGCAIVLAMVFAFMKAIDPSAPYFEANSMIFPVVAWISWILMAMLVARIAWKGVKRIEPRVNRIDLWFAVGVVMLLLIGQGIPLVSEIRNPDPIGIERSSSLSIN